MKSALLSCQCRVRFEPPPNSGDVLICRKHGTVKVIGNLKLECQDERCGYVKFYDELEKLTVCVYATKHMIAKGHRVRHFNTLDKDGTMCLHEFKGAPAITAGSPPPY